MLTMYTALNISFLLVILGIFTNVSMGYERAVHLNSEVAFGKSYWGSSNDINNFSDFDRIFHRSRRAPAPRKKGTRKPSTPTFGTISIAGGKSYNNAEWA